MVAAAQLTAPLRALSAADSFNALNSFAEADDCLQFKSWYLNKLIEQLHCPLLLTFQVCHMSTRQSLLQGSATSAFFRAGLIANPQQEGAVHYLRPV